MYDNFGKQFSKVSIYFDDKLELCIYFNALYVFVCQLMCARYHVNY